MKCRPPAKANLAALLGLVLTLCLPPVYAGTRTAPEWDVSEWLNGPPARLEDLQGKVVIVEFFQLWCPGCNRFSIPLMQTWTETFADEIHAGRLFMVSIHTVFEGHDYQTPARLRTFIKEKGIHHLVGIDRHEHGEHLPETMKKYRTRGTPEMAIIDKRGHIRFQKFGGFEPAKVERLIKSLLEE